jgi:hypothetical protein
MQINTPGQHYSFAIGGVIWRKSNIYLPAYTFFYFMMSRNNIQQIAAIKTAMNAVDRFQFICWVWCHNFNFFGWIWCWCLQIMRFVSLLQSHFHSRDALHVLQCPRQTKCIQKIGCPFQYQIAYSQLNTLRQTTQIIKLI